MLDTTEGPAAAATDGAFTVRLAVFEGPFDLLLGLISKHRLDITEIALAEVTDEFLSYIKAQGADWDLGTATEFLVVAVTLLDLKVARLLPGEVEPDEEDLALLEARDLLFARLLQYRAYREAAQLLAGLMTVESRMHPRSVGLEERYAALLPEVVIPVDPQGLAALAAAAMSAPRLEPVVRLDHLHARRVSVREEAVIVVDRLQLRSPQPFRALIHDCVDDVLRVVGRFLALLELYREGRVTLAQADALGELLVTLVPRTGGDHVSGGDVHSDAVEAEIVLPQDIALPQEAQA